MPFPFQLWKFNPTKTDISIHLICSLTLAIIQLLGKNFQFPDEISTPNSHRRLENFPTVSTQVSLFFSELNCENLISGIKGAFGKSPRDRIVPTCPKIKSKFDNVFIRWKWMDIFLLQFKYRAIEKKIRVGCDQKFQLAIREISINRCQS
jgi:hypothetical protein